jgi:hypothetical protein
MSLEDSINKLIDASGEQTARADALNQTVVDKIGDIDARVAQKLAETDQFITDSRVHLTRSFVAPYDRGENFSKSGLGIVADAIDNTQSEWKLVVPAAGQVNWYPSAGKLTYLRLKQAYSSPPGYYENPPYFTDHSRTHMRFVVSHTAATPAQIKEQIDVQGIDPAGAGNWGTNSTTLTVDCMVVPNVHQYMGLWVQFFNIGWGINGNGNGVPQEITTYGGNTNFTVDTIENYPNLDA